MNETIGAVIAALVVTAGVLPAAAVGAGTVSTEETVPDAGTAEADAYHGTHVSFAVEGSAVSNYTVDGEHMVSGVAVESEESYRSRTGLGAGLALELSSVTEIRAAGGDLSARSETRATVRAKSGAELRAHDNGNGVLVVAAENGSQVVAANLSASASAEAESDARVVVTNGNGTEGAFVVVGDGEVTVNEEGDVSARLSEDARLVFRAYPEERDEDDRRQESMIAEGEVAAEVYVMAESEGEGTVTDTVRYDENTTVETRTTAENAVEMTVERSEHEGRVILTSVSEAAVGSTEDMTVTVDGEAAARASSYSELRSAAAGGERSKFMVVQESSAEASADVLVAVNHFSTRTVTIAGADSGSGDSDDGSTGADGTTTADDDTGSGTDDGVTDDGTSDDGPDGNGDEPAGQPLPGFGPIAALLGVGILAVAGLLSRRR